MRTIIRRRSEALAVEGDEGFTLIELLVVLLVIGILLGIAIPTYLSVTSGAKKSSAESNLNTALTGANAVYAQNSGSFGTGTGVDAALVTSLQGVGTSLQFNATGSTGANTVEVDAPDGTTAVLVAYDGSSNCYAVATVQAAGDTGTVAKQVTGTAELAGTYWAKFSAGTTSLCTTGNAEASTVTWSTSAP